MNLIESSSDRITFKLVDCERIKEVLYVKIRLNNKAKIIDYGQLFKILNMT